MERFPQDTTPLPPSRPGSSHWRMGGEPADATPIPDDAPTTYSTGWQNALYPPHDAPTIASRIPADVYENAAYASYGDASQRRPAWSATHPAAYRTTPFAGLHQSRMAITIAALAITSALIATLALGFTLGRSMGLVGGHFPGGPTHTPVITDFLSGALASTPASVNLTSEGAKDWAHWGLQSASDFDHKASGGAISDFTSVGSPYVVRYATSAIGFSWSDGAPTGSATHTTTELFFIGEHSGFTFSVPADRTLRTLRIYVAVYAAHGQLQATLSNSSLAPYANAAIDTSSATSSTNAVYTIVFRSRSPNQRLTIQFTTLSAHNFLGSVGLQSATLN
ncbi:MAG: hypothetical protein ABI068_18170 [Ktedonobacterales bacterium]